MRTSLSLVTLTGWVLKETLAQPDFCLDESRTQIGLVITMLWVTTSRTRVRQQDTKALGHVWLSLPYWLLRSGAQRGRRSPCGTVSLHPGPSSVWSSGDALLPARFLPAVALGEDHSSDAFTDDGKAWTSGWPRSHWG